MIGKEKQEKRTINLNFEKAETKYVNLSLLSHSQAEFIIDFARILPGMVKPEVQDRIVMTPIHAKLLLNALSENIKKYEEKFGKIEIPTGVEEGTETGYKS
ncbi:MAG: DUF3467 domain-containing protein [Candidatus Stahlbacteria bacterium]|jgi:hypothetical protein|nr:DUF3467 domain-containing protein [candidate division WOR-3 bacterium]TEU00042.1 MAG: DUF3467 domain-containing protein [Candidatus Stahlbacteria bacterium]